MTTQGRQHFADVMKGRNPEMGEMIMDYLSGLNPMLWALKSGRDKAETLESYGVKRICSPWLWGKRKGVVRSRNVDASRGWEQPLGNSQQKIGSPYSFKETTWNLNKQETLSPIVHQKHRPLHQHLSVIHRDSWPTKLQDIKFILFSATKVW